MKHALLIFLLMSFVYSDHSYAQRLFKVSTLANAELLSNDINTVRAAYEMLGIKLEITPLPAQRSLVEAQENIVFDAELARVVQAESQLTNLIRIPVSLKEISLVAVAHNKLQGLSGQQGIESLEQFRVGSMRGLVITDLLLKHIDNQLVDRTKQGFDMLLYKRLEVFVIPKFMVSKLPIKLLDGGYIIHEPPLLRVKIYHFVHKKHQALIPDITAALSEVTGNPIE